MASKVQVDKIARASGTPEFTIPTADGAANTFLKTDGSGVLSFGAVTTTALTGSTNTWIPTITAANALTGTANFTYDGNTLDIKNSGTASSIKLYCESSNAHAQEIKAAPHAGSSAWTLTLPSTVPSVSGQALTATTAGVASWATVTAADNTPSFFVTGSGNQAISNETWTKVVWSTTSATEEWDTDSAFASDKFTVPSGEGGKYQFSFGGLMDELDNLETWNMDLYVNGSEHSGGNTLGRASVRTYATNLGNFANSTIALDLSAADYVEVYFYHNEGATQNLLLNRSYFQGFKLAGV